MLSTKLIKNLKLLNKQSLNQFEKFVDSPYFLKRKQVSALFKEIKSNAPIYEVDKREVFSKAFPGKPYNDMLMRKYISELHRMLEEYRAISSFRKDFLRYTDRLTEDYILLKNYDEAEKLSSFAINRLESKKLRNENYYYNKFIFEKHLKTISNKRTNLNPDSDWKPAMDSFVNYSAIMLLKFYTILLNDIIFRRAKSDISFELLDELVKVFEHNVIAGNPVAAIQYNIVLSYLEPENVKHYYAIKNLLFEYEGLMEEDEVDAIYTHLHNYSYIKVDNGNMNFLNERFEISSKVLSRGYSVKDGIIPDMFISITINALMLDKFEWTEEFIKKYKNFLLTDNKQAVINFTYAIFFMFTKDFDKALGYLSRVKFSAYYDKLKIKWLNLMIYYEGGMYESAFSLADSFRHFILKYKSITPYVKERTGNFIKQVLQLIKYRLNEADKAEIKEFQTKAVMHRPWLVQKIEEAKAAKK